MRWVYASLVALGIAIAVTVIVVVTLSSGENSGASDAESAAKAHTPPEKVRVAIAGTNDAKEEVTDGGIVGEGTFRATGAITDSGWVRAYRSVPNDKLILLRFVTKGKKGTITYLVDIHIARLPPVSRWKIESATKAYQGLQGAGNESENATYTVSNLKGSVWR
jgi:hypothetical protein